ncbi:hypothetical protein HCN_1930 [Helicobacter cinaedi PAGU611]|uniref:hypothetical protein n=2 Tax=Helicobacter cinaedi TaxID=213 RepID=UPI00025D35BA|nr:hypothetical protein [Helicobacter cinaedi]BAM13086.1 hypothetical protein HCN_1930 [Helicobacter cinaedi PAGU611]BBB20997.1 hypothetical protein HC081234_21740 [Helicobacter cinaedi]
MGNRCVITNNEKTRAIYQHWNGGRDSIEPLLKVAKDLGKGFDGLVEVSAKVFDGEEIDYVEREFLRGSEQKHYNPLRMEIFIRLTYELGAMKKEEIEKIMSLVDDFALNTLKGE